MTTVIEHIKDLLVFFIDTNYVHHLSVINKSKLDETELEEYVRKIYIDKREEGIEFIKKSLPIILKDEYPGDKTIMKIINSQDDHEKIISNIIIHIKVKNK